MTPDPAAAPVLLTLVMPIELEEELVEALLEFPLLVPGFTSDPVEGRGGQVRFAGSAEEVRGSALYARVQLVIETGRAVELLEILRARFPTPRVFWWTVPVADCGRLA